MDFENEGNFLNSSLQKYNQEQEIRFSTSETGKKIKHEKRKSLLVKLCYQAFSLLLVEIQTSPLLEGI